MTGLRYVYAVCRPFGAALQSQLTGVAGAPPKLLHHGGLVAVVSSVPEDDFAEEPLRAHLEDLDWLTATARSHQGVIDALTTVTTPLPLRLGTVFRDDSGVRMMLEAREGDFLRTLDRLSGRVEWGVKVYAEPAAGESGEPGASGVSARPGGEAGEPGGAAQGPGTVDGVAVTAMSGRDYLRRRSRSVKERETGLRKVEEFADRLHERLTAHAEDARMHAPQSAQLSGASGRNVLNAAYLVPRGQSEEFVEIVDRTKDEMPGVRVELTGPWAAYSFAGEKP
ncbi:GvpL/GvpF family gas vesicle protein [Streptomyces sp. NPDC089424]|uniref:GvpL/GvpF family gas vesicle protein n=1 Tax=Streptomyces sp. NPDC089424 TaxID=3365917 RepID=UPI00380887A9